MVSTSYPEPVSYAFYRSPVGWITLVSQASGLCSLRFGRVAPRGARLDLEMNRAAMGQVREYFEEARKSFDLPLDLEGTPFQLAVWNALREIPYGETRSYGEIAQRIGRPGAARAVGAANHDNPVAIVVPCHRVIGSDGSLTGYAGGLDLKARLLAFEGALAPEESDATAPIRGRSTTNWAPVLS